MNIEFEKPYLEELYTQGKTTDKKHRFQPQVIKSYIKAVDKLRAAIRIEDLYPIKSLNYEKLTGSNTESVRIDYHYRLLFQSRLQETITICSLTDISNHYQ